MTPTDEQLINAYADGELTPDEEASVLERLQTDAAFARRVCELDQLKKQIGLAYATPPRRIRQHANRVRNHFGDYRSWAAACLILAVGAVAGWLAHTPSQSDRLVLLDPTGRGGAPAAAGSPDTRIVFHLNNPDQSVAGELLDEVERILLAYQVGKRPLRVEIVSHGQGLTLLRERLSLHKARVRDLARRFENLTFVACLNTMERLRTEHGVEVQLVPEAEVTRSGVSHVVRRQREGWSYIRV